LVFGMFHLNLVAKGGGAQQWKRNGTADGWQTLGLFVELLFFGFLTHFITTFFPENKKKKTRKKQPLFYFPIQ
jgi:hypothetical protein